MATQADKTQSADVWDEDVWAVCDEDVFGAITEYLPDDIADIVFRLTDYQHVEWVQYYLQQSLNVEIGNKVFWSDNKAFWCGGFLEVVSDNYCADCGQHKTRRVDSGRFSIGCRVGPVFSWEEQKPCREVKFTICDCHDCEMCEANMCIGNHRQCTDCTGTFIPGCSISSSKLQRRLNRL